MGSESISSTSGSSESVTPVTNAPADATKAAPNAAAGTVNANDTFSSLADLRDRQPELYKKMMEGIAQNICMQIKRNEDHLREMQRQYRDG